MKNGAPDCVVIGAGVIGCAIALRLQRTGYAVLLLEADRPGAGVSVGNAGMVGPNAVIPMVTPGFLRQMPSLLFGADKSVLLNLRALPTTLHWLLQCLRQANRAGLNRSRDGLYALHQHALTDWQRLIGDEAYQRLFRPGSTVSQHKVQESDAAVMHSLSVRLRLEVNVSTRILSQSAIKQCFPQLEHSGSVFTAVDYTAVIRNPERLLLTLVEQFIAAGGRYQRIAAKQFIIGNGQVNALACGEKRFTACHYILAAGSDSPALLPVVWPHLPLIAERGYHIMLKRPRPLFHARPDLELVPCALHDAARKRVISEMDGGIRVAGYVEYATPDSPADLRCYDRLERHFLQHFPGYSIERQSQWFGHRPSTPDSLPYIGRHFEAPNLICAFGHGHYGMSGAPATAELVNGIIQETASAKSLQPFDPRRFSIPDKENRV